MQARPLLQARGAGRARTATSLDLGRSRADVELTGQGVCGPGVDLPWPLLEAVADDDTGCWEVGPGGIGQRIQVLSEVSGRLASLYPTPGPPALLLSGTPMHRIQGVDPGQDTRLKLAPLGRLDGLRLLDTATGLGYTAVEAARRGARVATVEWDPAVVAVCRRNPWSAELFAQPAVDRRQADVAQEVETFGDGAFDRVLHDPPVIGLAGDLYGGAFYRQLHRVLAPGGRLFHYVGNPDSPSGQRTVRGVERRLLEAGFTRLRRHPEAFGLSAGR